MAPQAAATQGLYERHAAKIQSYCHHQLGSREEAEDAVQTTFMNAFRALGRGVVPEAESAWLFKIAENVCLSRRRSSWRRGRIESPNDFEVIEEIVPGPSRQHDELIGIEDALASMPEQQRRAILLREWQGLSYREVAEELGVSQSAVETLIFRARRSLAQGLEQPDAIKPKRKSFRRALHALDLGGALAALKTLLAGSAAVKATAAAVAVTAAAGTAATVTPKIEGKLPGRSKPAVTAVAASMPALSSPSSGARVGDADQSRQRSVVLTTSVVAGGGSERTVGQGGGSGSVAAMNAMKQRAHSGPSGSAGPSVQRQARPLANGPVTPAAADPAPPAAETPAVAPADEPARETAARPADEPRQPEETRRDEPRRDEAKRPETKREEAKREEASRGEAKPVEPKAESRQAPTQPRADEGRKDDDKKENGKRDEGKKDESKRETESSGSGAKGGDAHDPVAPAREFQAVVSAPAENGAPAESRKGNGPGKGGDREDKDDKGKDDKGDRGERKDVAAAAPAPVQAPAPPPTPAVTAVTTPVSEAAAAPAPAPSERDRDRDRDGGSDKRDGDNGNGKRKGK